MRYLFLGVQRLDFTNERGEVIRGWNLWLGCPSTGQSVGFRPKKCFFSDDAMIQFASVYGGVDGFKSYVGKECKPLFNEYGKPYDLNFK